MDTRTIGALRIKVAGLVIITYCVAQLPSFLPLAYRGRDWSPAEVLAALLIGIGPLMLLGLVMWFFPGKLANRMVSPAATDDGPGAGRLESLALATLGVFLIASAVVELLRNVVYIIALHWENPDIGLLPASVIARLAGLLVQAVIGTILCIGGPAVWREIVRLRG